MRKVIALSIVLGMLVFSTFARAPISNRSSMSVDVSAACSTVATTANTNTANLVTPPDVLHNAMRSTALIVTTTNLSSNDATASTAVHRWISVDPNDVDYIPLKTASSISITLGHAIYNSDALKTQALITRSSTKKVVVTVTAGQDRSTSA